MVRCTSANILLVSGGAGGSHNNPMLLPMSGIGIHGGNVALYNTMVMDSSNTKMAVPCYEMDPPKSPNQNNERSGKKLAPNPKYARPTAAATCAPAPDKYSLGI